MTALTAYHKRLFVFLSVATFFEGYDFTALSQILPNLQDEMAISDAGLGRISSIINLGTIVSFALVRLADRIGRRRVLATTILGYATFTFLTGTADSAAGFAAFQFSARVFLIAEWALSMVIAAEEFPADRRGFVIGVLQAFNSLGSIACAAVVPLLLGTPLGWRSVYFVGILPLLLLAYARGGLKETALYSRYVEARGATHRGLFAIMHSPYRRRVLQMALIWGLTYACTNTALLFWKQFAVTERGLTDGDVARAVTIATLIALPFVFSVGKVLDWWGRKRSAVLIYGTGAVFVVGAYQLEGVALLTACLTASIFAAIALLSLLNAFTTELFPTEIRADAFAWSNNLLGRIGYVIAPWIVGHAAERVGWGNAVSLTTVAVIAALGLILWLIPETSGKEIEEAARL